MATDDPIIGGDTPYMLAIEAQNHLPASHRATRFMKDGEDHTRIIQLGVLAAAWNEFATYPESELGAPHPEFMRQMIAGANTGLRTLGIAPLISIPEVQRTAAWFAESPRPTAPEGES